MYRHTIIATFSELFGCPKATKESGDVSGTVAFNETRWLGRDNQNGVMFCSGHVMPIRNGRLLNAEGSWGKQCEGFILWNISEVVR